MDRVCIRGTSGSGKTTLGRELARRMGCEAFDLDDLYWLPEWQTRPVEEFKALVAEAAAKPRWVMMGNYGKVRELLDARTDTVVWLDYPMGLTFWRVFRRTARRCITRERCCNGNREGFWRSFFRRDSVIWWSLSTHGRRRRECLAFLAEPHGGQVRLRHRSPRETSEWLRNVQQSSA